MFSNIDFVAELKQDKITTQLRLITLIARKPKKEDTVAKCNPIVQMLIKKNLEHVPTED